MKEEVSRIMKMVQDGRLSPEDATELIEALHQSDEGETHAKTQTAGNAEENANNSGPTSSQSGQRESSAGKDPFKALIDVIESFGKEASQSIDFKTLSSKIKDSAKEGAKAAMDALKEATEHGFTFGLIESRNIELPLPSLEGKSLVVENHCGNIEVSGGAEIAEVCAMVKVRGGTEIRRKEQIAEYVLHIEETETEVIIRQAYVPNLQLNLQIHASGSPNCIAKTDSSNIKATELGASKLESRSGNLSACQMKGATELSTVSGDIYGSGLEGSAVVESKSGNVVLEQVFNTLAARSTSGDLTISNFKGNTASLEAVSGNISASEFGPIVGAANLRSVSGDISLTLTEGSDCMVALSSVSGEFNLDANATDVVRSGQRVTGKIGDGRGTLDLSTVSGNIEVLSPVRQAQA